jgi:hypothetical protein
MIAELWKSGQAILARATDEKPQTSQVRHGLRRQRNETTSRSGLLSKVCYIASALSKWHKKGSVAELPRLPGCSAEAGRVELTGR